MKILYTITYVVFIVIGFVALFFSKPTTALACFGYALACMAMVRIESLERKK